MGNLCPFIAMLLYKDIQLVTILIDCSPKIAVLTADRNEYFFHGTMYHHEILAGAGSC